MIQGKVFERVNVKGNIFPVTPLSQVKTDSKERAVTSAVQLSNDFYSRHREICRRPSPQPAPGTIACLHHSHICLEQVINEVELMRRETPSHLFLQSLKAGQVSELGEVWILCDFMKYTEEAAIHRGFLSQSLDISIHSFMYP